jgi:hypothetical protein
MIKFFRHIRKNLMEQNKTGKYLKYAIGEIVLVVIGILIALSINNQNEIRKEKYNESVLLSNLKEEFIFNKIEFQDTEINLNSRIKTLRSLLELFGRNKETVNIRQLDSLLYRSFFAPQADISEGVFNSITNSGKLELLSNTKLKNLLLLWESKLKTFKLEEVNMFENLNKNIVPRMEERIAFQNIEKFGSIKGIEDSKLIPDNRIVLKDEVAENLIFNHLWELNNVLEIYPSIYKLLDEIIVEIKSDESANN